MASYGASTDVINGNLSVLGNFLQPAVTDNVTAKAGGGQTVAGLTTIPATTTYVRVTTVATLNDSITLPLVSASGLGDEVVVYNAGANALNVFPNLGDSINAGAANAAFSVPAGKGCSFVATAFVPATGVGRWNTLLGA